MMAMAVAGLALAAVSAVGQYKSGKAQESMYKSQANMAEFEGRSKAIQYKQQGVKALDGLVRANAQVNAAAGAGLVKVDLTGSAGTVMNANRRIGITDWNTAKRNATMATEMAGMQANIYRSAGKTAARSGLYSAIGTMGSGMLMFGMMGGLGGGAAGGASAGTGWGGYYSGEFGMTNYAASGPGQLGVAF